MPFGVVAAGTSSARRYWRRSRRLGAVGGSGGEVGELDIESTDPGLEELAAAGEVLDCELACRELSDKWTGESGYC